jgi:DNA-binding NarL/FixJ family response regulator
LSPSEEEVYPLLLAGLSNREIAAALGIELTAANARVRRACQVHGVTTVRRLLAKRLAEMEQRLASETKGTAEPSC